MVSYKEKAFELPEFDASKVGQSMSDAESSNWEGAHRVSVGEMVQGEEVFFHTIGIHFYHKTEFSKIQTVSEIRKYL